MNNNKLQYHPSLSSETIAEIAWGNVRPKRFLAAWKKGIKLVGEEYFKLSGKVEDATDKEDLRPDKDMIEHALYRISRGHAVFLAALYSFYDSQTGQKYLEQLGYPNISDIAGSLDRKYLEVIAELFINYSGW